MTIQCVYVLCVYYCVCGLQKFKKGKGLRARRLWLGMRLMLCMYLHSSVSMAHSNNNPGVLYHSALQVPTSSQFPS